MSESKWKVGDIVRLKSGGPNMTVDGYVTPTVPFEGSVPVVQCTWFSKLGGLYGPETFAAEPSCDDFSEDALLKVAL